jgi:hypothetical protein
MMTAVGQAYAVKRISDYVTSFGGRNAGVNKRKFDIFLTACNARRRSIQMGQEETLQTTLDGKMKSRPKAALGFNR